MELEPIPPLRLPKHSGRPAKESYDARAIGPRYIGSHQATDESRVQRNIRRFARLAGASVADIDVKRLHRALGGES